MTCNKRNLTGACLVWISAVARNKIIMKQREVGRIWDREGAMNTNQNSQILGEAHKLLADFLLYGVKIWKSCV